MKIKHSVDVYNPSVELLLGLMVAEGVYREHGQELVVTSMRDSKHKVGSLHRWQPHERELPCNAADLRTHYFDNVAQGRRVSDKLREALPDDYDVVYEGDHIHLEYDPKTRPLSA